MNEIIKNIEEAQMKAEVPAFNVGDTVRVSAKIKEGNRESIVLQRMGYVVWIPIGRSVRDRYGWIEVIGKRGDGIDLWQQFWHGFQRLYVFP